MRAAHILLAIPVLSLTLLSAPVRAQDVAPLVPVVETDMGEELIVRFHEAMGQGLRTGGLKVIPPAQVVERMQLGVKNAGCFEGACVLNARQRLGVERIAVAKISAVGKSYTIAMKLYKGTQVLGSGTGRCDICTMAEALQTMNSVAEELGTRTEEPPSDEKPTQPRPAQPGTQPGARPAQPPKAEARPVPPKPRAQAGVQPAKRPSPRPVAARRAPVASGEKTFPLWPALVAGGAGLGALGGGIALLVLDGKGTNCTVPLDKRQECEATRGENCECFEYYTTATGGWVLTGVGVAALAGAGALLYLHLTAKPEERRGAGLDSLGFSPTPGGGFVLGATGRF